MIVKVINLPFNKSTHVCLNHEPNNILQMTSRKYFLPQSAYALALLNNLCNNYAIRYENI